MLGLGAPPVVEGAPEPTLSLVTPAEAGAHEGMGLGPRPGDRAVAQQGGWGRRRGPAGRLFLPLWPPLLWLGGPRGPPARTEPIPVQLVIEPPPEAKPSAPRPQPKPDPPPPRGRLASEDLGEPDAKEA